MTLITKQDNFLHICQLIKQHKIVAVDSEFIREKSYIPLLCLIQFNINGECFAVDCLSPDISLKPFVEILNDKTIIKIFHCAKQDIEILGQNLPNQVNPKNIFDTQIVAALCGFDYNISYSNLVKNFFGKEVNKNYQRSNWQIRPLIPEQINYALSDVLYLPEIHKILYNKLIEQNKEKWLLSEMKLLVKQALDNNLEKNFSFFKRSKIYQENIKILVRWRDKIAKEINVPRGIVLKDDILSKIATNNPKNLSELNKCGFRNRCNKKDLEIEIIELLRNKDEKLLKEKLSKYYGPNQQQKKIYLTSKDILINNSKRYNVCPQLVINQHNLQHIIFGYRPINYFLNGWRYVVLGEELENLL